MSRTLQLKGFANTTLATTVGKEREVIIDTTNWTGTVHDGITPGGHRLATEDFVNKKYITIVNNGGNQNTVSGGVSASGFLPNSVIFANNTGYLSNVGALSFYSSNNSLVVQNVVLSPGNGGSITFSDGTVQSTAGIGSIFKPAAPNTYIEVGFPLGDRGNLTDPSGLGGDIIPSYDMKLTLPIVDYRINVASKFANRLILLDAGYLT
jgi:hypothetical protein